MDYQFENLGPERFQQFCQALLSREFPKLQSYPVGQPDGGRDALSFIMGGSSDEFIVFQVKFVRRPFAVTDIHKWLVDIIKDEAPKIAKLVPRGATEYYLLTNVPGTAHLQSGSIDKVQEIFNQHIRIPSMCWWRDDLNARLDTAWQLKWSYPELLSGIDILQHVVQAQLSEDAERRTSAVRAFVRDQYEIDKEVRFKQIELQNQLLDLFVDIPIVVANRNSDSKTRRRHMLIFRQVAGDVANEHDSEAGRPRQGHFFYDEMSDGIGAAAALLHPLIQSRIPQLVLEGAPGQGKSTIAQYVCQIHRMKILSEDRSLSQVPQYNQSISVRIPFRVDLRDLATWFDGRDPFSPSDTHEVPEDWHKSLEAFLAAQVKHHAGGIEFTITDLHAVARLSAIALILDGLDEVADIATRSEVVSEVMAGVRRLKESAYSIQIIITSRPAAFANSPGFPEDQYPHFELGSITRSLIDEYAGKWLKARRFSPRESKEIKSILREKLDEPHLRELARNPMQLAILLSLIHTRGSSLPDKRTALYDHYVELFFSREAEKSVVVRDHRDLLVDIHQYLGWFLQAESEQRNRSGNISSERLKHLLSTYLESQHQDPTFADKLFAGMVERVVALVSRVEGTYEFEVQPLREYFAARYSYETAPYSPPGRESKGTKPDRFNAIARNFYWLNVTRFYAGCYSKGELPSLVDSLTDLVEENGYRYINHPRVLAMILLSDWVFAQHPKSMKQAVSLVADGLGLRYALNGSRLYRGFGTPWSLPKNNGKDDLVARCFEILQKFPALDYVEDITSLLRANASREELFQEWNRFAADYEGEKRTRWMEYGLLLGLLALIDLDGLEELFADQKDEKSRLRLMFRARRTDFLETTAERLEKIVDLILNGMITVHQDWRTSSILEQFAHTLDPTRYAIAFQSRSPTPLSEYSELRFLYYVQRYGADTGDHDKQVEHSRKYPVLEWCQAVIERAKIESNRASVEWATLLEPWEAVVETSRQFFGERWCHFHLANVASGIKSRTETSVNYSELFDTSQSLCQRARYARLRAGNPRWWEEQFECADSILDRMFFVSMLLTWGSNNTLLVLMDQIALVLEELPDEEWQLVINSLWQATRLARVGTGTTVTVDELPSRLPARVATAVAVRVNDKHEPVIYERYFQSYKGKDPSILELCQKGAMQLLKSKVGNSNQHLEVIRRSYREGVIAPDVDIFLFARQLTPDFLTLLTAEKIAKSPERYPNYLTNLAEAKWRKHVSKRIKSVGQIAEEESWFELL